MNDMIQTAQQMDLNRQRQIEAQKQSINRLLEARESEIEDKVLVAQLIDERTKRDEVILELQAKLEGVGLVVKNWGEDARDRIVDALAGRG